MRVQSHQETVTKEIGLFKVLIYDLCFVLFAIKDKIINWNITTTMPLFYKIQYVLYLRFCAAVILYIRSYKP